jgi:hypothetical protein
MMISDSATIKRAEASSSTTHFCSRCGVEKPYVQFSPKTSGGWQSITGRRASACKLCVSLDARYRRAPKLGTVDPAELLRSARKRARKKGLDLSITLDDILIPTHCPVLGIPLVPSPPGIRSACDNSPTIDRIDSTKGYVSGNVIIVSWKANRIKTNATPDELIKVARFYQSLTSTPQSTGEGVCLAHCSNPPT